MNYPMNGCIIVVKTPAIYSEELLAFYVTLKMLNKKNLCAWCSFSCVQGICSWTVWCSKLPSQRWLGVVGTGQIEYCGRLIVWLERQLKTFFKQALNHPLAECILTVPKTALLHLWILCCLT